MNRYSIRIADTTCSVCRYLVFTDTPFGLIIDQTPSDQTKTEIQICPIIERYLVDDPIVVLQYDYLDSNYALLVEIDTIVEFDIYNGHLDVGLVHVECADIDDEISIVRKKLSYSIIEEKWKECRKPIRGYYKSVIPEFVISCNHTSNGVNIIKNCKDPDMHDQPCTFYNQNDLFATRHYSAKSDITDGSEKSIIVSGDIAPLR